jgi:hypothetical protein
MSVDQKLCYLRSRCRNATSVASQALNKPLNEQTPCEFSLTVKQHGKPKGSLLNWRFRFEVVGNSYFILLFLSVSDHNALKTPKFVVFVLCPRTPSNAGYRFLQSCQSPLNAVNMPACPVRRKTQAKRYIQTGLNHHVVVIRNLHFAAECFSSLPEHGGHLATDPAHSQLVLHLLLAQLADQALAIRW